MKIKDIAVLKAAWERIGGFAVYESDSGVDGVKGRYRIIIDYPTLDKAQDAYKAMTEITKLLTK